jgi:hypothetical protein
MTSITQPTDAVIFIGMQASGKTSLDRQRFFETHLRIGLDMMRTGNGSSCFWPHASNQNNLL